MDSPDDIDKKYVPGLNGNGNGNGNGAHPAGELQLQLLLLIRFSHEDSHTLTISFVMIQLGCRPNAVMPAGPYDNVYAVEEPAKPKEGYAWTKQW